MLSDDSSIFAYYQEAAHIEPNSDKIAHRIQNCRNKLYVISFKDLDWEKCRQALIMGGAIARDHEQETEFEYLDYLKTIIELGVAPSHFICDYDADEIRLVFGNKWMITMDGYNEFLQTFRDHGLDYRMFVFFVVNASGVEMMG